jgi:hypothetical protein
MGRNDKCALELMELDITYVPQMAIKSQALMDFKVEWTETQQPPTPDTWEHRSMHFDGSFTLNVGRGRCCADLPHGRLTPLCESTALPHDKQYSGI